MTAVTRGETALGSTVLHGVINEIVRGFPVEPVLPCEGVGYEVGSMAIIKGARNLGRGQEVRRLGADAGRPEDRRSTSRSTRSRPTATSRCRRRCRTLTTIKVIDYDFAKYGSRAERKRLLERWEREINSLPR